MTTYTITLTQNEHSALLLMLEKGWDYMKDGDYFYGEGDLEQQCLDAWHKAEHPTKNN